MKKILLKVANKFGYTIKRVVQNSNNEHSDIRETEFWEIYNFCKPYTRTSVERMYTLYSAVNYILSTDVKGAFVECGVWRGGSAMLIARMLHNRKISDRKIYLYDTFEGMSEPTGDDVDVSGKDASAMLKATEHDKETSVWCLADLEDVQNNMQLTGLSGENIFYIKGKVENTLPEQRPDVDIALLRLDTDWYESTKHELVYLFPKLAVNGVIVIDDYGHWQGCRKAVDEYIKENNVNMLLNRIDYTGRIGIKTT